MKMIRLTITLFALFSFYQNFAQTYAEHRAVQARAYWDPNDLSVVIEWDADDQVQSYILYRRDWGERNWGKCHRFAASNRSFVSVIQILTLQQYMNMSWSNKPPFRIHSIPTIPFEDMDISPGQSINQRCTTVE